MLPSKWKKLESLFYKMFARNYHLLLIAGRANILSKYIICIFFSFGRGFCSSFLMSFPKAPASCFKKILNQFFTTLSSLISKTHNIMLKSNWNLSQIRFPGEKLEDISNINFTHFLGNKLLNHLRSSSKINIAV